jgi:cell fate regulator YaaT (PSP1 superfamily)
VSVRLTQAGRAQTFAVADDEPRPLSPGTPVVVTTEQGEAVGDVVPMLQIRDEHSDAVARGRRLVRLASHEDIVARTRHRQREAEARRVAQTKIRALGLAMKLVRVEQAFDGTRLLFYFTADARVDFRELVRELAAVFRTRIEMRHIGVRDEAQVLGGYGTCGRPLCCTTFLASFPPVSIKMAKQQHLNLNPSKLSGMCGRLKCCLRFELPNAKGDTHAGCGREGSCETSSSGGRCASCAGGECRCR